MENNAKIDNGLKNEDETLSNQPDTTEIKENKDMEEGGKPLGSETGVDEGKKLRDELAEMKDKYLRLYSEFDNFRRRTAREKLDMVQNANEQLIQSLLPVMDDFERAEKSFKENYGEKDLEGLQLILGKFRKTLEQQGVKAMDIQAGADFNPDTQEAITQVPAPNENMKGKVMDIVEKGYLLNEKLIRFAKVIIGN